MRTADKFCDLAGFDPEREEAVVYAHDGSQLTLIEIDGTEGTIRLDAGYRLTVTTAAGSRVEDVSPTLLPWAERPWHNIQESVLAIQRHWVDCLRGGVEPETSGTDNLKTLALVEAAYLSAAEGRSIDPDTL